MSDIIQLDTDTDLFGQDVAAGPNIDRETLAAGLYHVLKDITLDEFCSYFVNGFDAMVSYAKLCAGEKDGQRISLLFNPHRLDTGTKRFPISLYAALKDERFVRGLARVVLLNMKKGNNKDLLYASIGMGVQGTSFVQEFPPHVARDLALEYNLTQTSKILDPCAGWGGRMLGFSAVVDSYTCCEPSTRTVAGLRQLLDFIHAFRSGFNATIFALPFEDVQLQNGAYDFAMTSPPYYDTEWYAPGELTSSGNRYPSFSAWCDGFYAPLIHRTMAALKPGAHFVLNIGSRTYPLNDKLFEIARDRYDVDKQKGRLSASNGLGKEGEGETFYEVKRRDGAVILLDEAALTQSCATCQLILESQTEPLSTDLSVKNLTPERLEASQTVEPAPQLIVSALDIALAERTPEPLAVSSETAVESAVPIAESEDKTNVPTPAEPLSPNDILTSFAMRGHVITRHGDMLRVTRSKELTEADRELLKSHKRELLDITPVYVEQVSVNATSLGQFLGNQTPFVEPNFIPDTPPSLDGINEIILNFATNGVDWDKGHRAIGVTVSTLDGQMTRFLPFAFQGRGNLDEAMVKEWARRELRGKKITNSKIRFDLHHSREWGVDLEEQGNTFSDIQHTAVLLNEHRFKFGLDALAEDYLPGNVEVPRVDEARHDSYAPCEVAAREIYTAQLVGRLRAVMYPLIDEQELRKVHDLEDAVIPCTVEMEKNGAQLDVELLEQYYHECNTTHDQLLLEISKECGFGFDHSASAWKRLFEYCKLTPSDDGYAEDIVGSVEHPLIKKGHYAAQIASLNSKTFAAYRKLINSDGVMRYDINQMLSEDGGTVNGRFSIGYVHQVPNHDNHVEVFGDLWNPRRIYIPKTGLYMDADAAQIEYRVFAHYANNPKVLKAYQGDLERLQRGEEIVSFHKMLWAIMKAFKPDMKYSYQKSFNFMKMYGGGLPKTAVMMKMITAAQAEEIRKLKTAKTDPRLTQAREIEAIYAREMPEVGPLQRRATHLAMTKCNDFCRQGDALHKQFPHRGYVKTLLGRRSRFPNDYKVYRGLNRVISGSAADINKQKLVELHKERKHTGFLLRLTVHDAVGGDAQEGDTRDKVSEILNRQSFPELKVDILWECKTGANWAACK